MHGVDPSDPSCIHSVSELEEKINEIGFLPLFAGEVPGFSVEEMTDPASWWTGDPATDPWEWREQIAGGGRVAYGKFFNRRAGFISEKYLPYFANYRRDGYDFDARWDDELASAREKKIMDLFSGEDSGEQDDLSELMYGTGAGTSASEATGDPDAELYSFEVKKKAGFSKGGEKNFEGVITGLQMKLYLICCDFRQRMNKKGEPYGWSIAVYSTPEHVFGRECVTAAYSEDPKESLKRLVNRVRELYPDAEEKDILKLLAYSEDRPQKKEALPWPRNLLKAIDRKKDPYEWTEDQVNGLYVAVGQLRPKHQKTIFEKYKYGMTYDEIGAGMNRAGSTVGTYHRKALQRLRRPLVAAWYQKGYRENLKACAAGEHWDLDVGEASDFITTDDLCLRIGIKVRIFENLMSCGIVTVGDLIRAMNEDPKWYRRVPKVGPATAKDIQVKLESFNIR